MASILQFLLYLLRKLCFTRGSIHHYIKRWTSFLAFLGRRFGINYLWHDRKRGTSHEPTQAGRSFSRTGGRLELGEFVVAASHIPASASHPSLHDVVGATGQPQTTTSRTSPPASVRAEPQRDHAHPTTTTLGVGIYSNRSITSLSVLSRASDRLPILQTHSYESLHATVGQATRFPSAHHRQFGRGPSATSNLELPEGRFLQLINSDQVPRYTKEVTVQVDYTITILKTNKSFCRPRERTFYEIPRRTTSFP
jgi:hypothetical protein